MGVVQCELYGVLVEIKLCNVNWYYLDAESEAILLKSFRGKYHSLNVNV